MRDNKISNLDSGEVATSVGRYSYLGRGTRYGGGGGGAGQLATSHLERGVMYMGR